MKKLTFLLLPLVVLGGCRQLTEMLSDLDSSGWESNLVSTDTSGTGGSSSASQISENSQTPVGGQWDSDLLDMLDDYIGFSDLPYLDMPNYDYYYDEDFLEVIIYTETDYFTACVNHLLANGFEELEKEEDADYKYYVYGNDDYYVGVYYEDGFTAFCVGNYYDDGGGGNQSDAPLLTVWPQEFLDDLADFLGKSFTFPIPAGFTEDFDYDYYDMYDEYCVWDYIPDNLQAFRDQLEADGFSYQGLDDYGYHLYTKDGVYIATDYYTDDFGPNLEIWIGLV